MVAFRMATVPCRTTIDVCREGNDGCSTAIVACSSGIDGWHSVSGGWHLAMVGGKRGVLRSDFRLLRGRRGPFLAWRQAFRFQLRASPLGRGAVRFLGTE